MQEGDRHRRLNTRCHQVHGVGTQHHTISAPGLQAPCGIFQDQRGIVPTPGMLSLFHRAEIHAVHQHLRRAQRAKMVAHALVYKAVILGAGLPAHAADKADGAHRVLLKKDEPSPYPLEADESYAVADPFTGTVQATWVIGHRPVLSDSSIPVRNDSIFC